MLYLVNSINHLAHNFEKKQSQSPSALSHKLGIDGQQQTTTIRMKRMANERPFSCDFTFKTKLFTLVSFDFLFCKVVSGCVGSCEIYIVSALIMKIPDWGQ